MPLMTIGKCFRGRDDCEAFDVVEATSKPITDEQMDTLDFIPDGFVCCGCVKPDARTVPQDAYRLCFKNAVVDDMTDNDEQDLVHLMKVIGTALSVTATRRVHSGKIEVPTSLFDDGLMSVETKQKIK